MSISPLATAAPRAGVHHAVATPFLGHEQGAEPIKVLVLRLLLLQRELAETAARRGLEHLSLIRLNTGGVNLSAMSVARATPSPVRLEMGSGTNPAAVPARKTPNWTPMNVLRFSFSSGERSTTLSAWLAPNVNSAAAAT
jgi:hypothetical protein